MLYFIHKRQAALMLAEHNCSEIHKAADEFETLCKGSQKSK